LSGDDALALQSRGPSGAHTGDLPQARALYAELCGWRPSEVETQSGSYLAMELGGALGGGIVECATSRPRCCPMSRSPRSTRRHAGRLGASVLLEPREGPAGWRSVVATPAGGELAFWQPKSRRAV
jgi:predicted enzyme related to lactoylglutathione lyase